MRMRPGRLTAVFVSVLFVAGCQSTSTPPPASPSRASSSAPAPTKALPAAAPTSETLIAAALASGAITTEQSLVYRALALFDSPGLPKEFHSDVPDLEAAGNLLRDIDDKESTLSPAALAQLAPYRVRPSDPTSIYSVTPARTGTTGTVAAAAMAPAADVAPAWVHLPAAGGKVQVWIKDSATAGDKLKVFADYVTSVWAAYPGIFTYPMPDTANLPSAALNPDSAIDIYFVNVGDIDPRRVNCVADSTDPKCVYPSGRSGYAFRVLPFTGHTASGSLVMDAGRSKDEMIDTLAHELAHASQFAYDMNESSWLMESTATWVAFKVDLKLGIAPDYQHKWLSYLYDGLDQTLTRSGDNNGNTYASWLYFLYASMQKGDGIVTQIWQKAAADGEQGANAVDQVFPFADNFAGYALRNWNRDPVTPMYKTVDATFPAYQPKIKNAVQTLYGTDKDLLEVDLPPLASAYYQYDFAADVRDVTFENDLQGYDAARVWALVEIDGKWQAPVDWTNAPKEKFCRNIPQANVSKIVIVVSNKSMTDDLTAPEPPKMIAGTTGCSGWSGTMKASESWDVENGHGTGTSTFSGVWMIDEGFDAGCDPASTDPCKVLLRPTGTISWTWDSHWGESPVCDQTKSGSLAAGQEKYPEIPQQALYMRPLGKDQMQYWGLGGFGVEGLKCENLILLGAYPPSYFSLPEEAHGGYPVDATGTTCNNQIWKFDAKADVFSGSCVAYKYQHAWASFEWNLTRVGPAAAP